MRYTTKSDLNEHTPELDLGSSCLHRNLPAMFRLLEALAAPGGVRWHDEPARMKELLTRRAAAYSSAVAPQVTLTLTLASPNPKPSPNPIHIPIPIPNPNPKPSPNPKPNPNPNPRRG